MRNNLRGQRPYPIDKYRKSRSMEILSNMGMTITELALHLGVNKGYISKIVSGRDISPTTEQRIATFLGVPKSALFPTRSATEIAQMRELEKIESQKLQLKKIERMSIRENALATQGVA